MKNLSLLVLGLCLTTAAANAQDDSDSSPGRTQVFDAVAASDPGDGGEEDFQPKYDNGGEGYFSNIQGPSAIAEAITPEIKALAGNLGNDPTRIFNYVHDHIRNLFYFGSKKGAALTLLERSGNDFDQCALLSALLQAANFSPGYQFGVMKMPYDATDGTHNDLHHWLRLSMLNTNWSNTVNYFGHLFGTSGNAVWLDNFGTNTIAFHRVWVTLAFGGTNYYLDPSFKVSEPVAGITNLASAMGLSTSTLLSAAGGTNTGIYVTNLNEASLRGALQNCNSNLLNYLSNNLPNATVQQVVGGQQIVSSAGLPLSTSLAFPIYTDSSYPLTNWTSQPTNFMATFSISLGGTNMFWYTPQLQGQRVSLTFSNNGLAQVWLEDGPVPVLQTTNTGSSSTLSVVLSANHPYGGWGTTHNVPVDVVSALFDQSSTNSYQRTNASYAILYGFEASPQWLQARQQKLDAYRQQGLSDSSWQVTTETLNVMGLNWMVQTELSQELLAQQWNQLPLQHHSFGRMGQEAGRGYYVDVYLQRDGTFPNSGFNAPDIQNYTQVFDVSDYLWSAMEHGIIEQLQSSNLVAASTVKMLEIASTNSQAIYLASGTNWTTGANVRSKLVNYGSTFSNLDYLINSGFTLLLPQNGSNHVAGTGSWAGNGYVKLLSIPNYRSMGMIIGGAYHGGYSQNPFDTINTPVVSDSGTAQPTFVVPTPAQLQTVTGGDPINMVDGSFQSYSTDLSLGQAEPRGLNLGRYYSTELRNYNFAGMANGWLHTYYFKLAPVSAPQPVLGTSTPQQMAPMLVATLAMLTLYNNTTPDPKNWTVTALIAKWGVDQLINNAVSVSMGKDTIQFTRQPDGTFTPPAGSTMTLTKSGSAYNLAERHGNTFKFDASNRLTNIVDQYSRGMNFFYNSSNWVSSITDWTNRSLTFTYSNTPSRLVSVADSTGRKVSYGYATNANGQLDLISASDPENKTNTFNYDTNHSVVATFDALNQLVVSNNYDGLGHITTQYTQGDTNKLWQIFPFGSQTIMIDPAGGQQQYFYDDKSRLIGMQDALGNLSQTVYDGQDHVIMTISPLNETNQFAYDDNQNLIFTIDPLGFTNQFIYDSQNNLVQSVDARGNPSHFGYNSKFQLTGTTNGAGDWTTLAYNSSDGTLASRTDPGGTTGYGYDSFGRVNSITYPNSLGSESFANSVLGDVTNHTNPRGLATAFQYNSRRQLTNTVTTNLTAKVAFDAVGNAVSMTDVRGFTSSNTWVRPAICSLRSCPPRPAALLSLATLTIVATGSFA